MRKMFALLLAVTMVAGLALTAYADVIWEPWGDNYYDSHREEFQYSAAVYYANSPTGKLVGYDKPDGEELIQAENGELIYGTYICTPSDGSSWAVGEARIGEEWRSVYYPLEDVLNRYDEEFFADHESEITDKQPEIAPRDGQAFLSWTYPGGVFTEEDPSYWESMEFSEACHRFYTDEDGNLWGYIGYWQGHRDIWVCLTDLNNPELQKPEILKGTVYFGENAAPLVERAPEKSGVSPLAIALPVAAVALAGAALAFWPKKKHEK